MDRLDRVRAVLPAIGIDGFLVAKPVNTMYLSRFTAVTYSRPILIFVGPDDWLVVPELEVQHARETSIISNIRTYSDADFGSGEGQSPLELALDAMVGALAASGVVRPGFRLGFESSYLTWLGYQALENRFPGRVVPTTGVVERQRLVKDREELELLRFACSIADVGMDVEVRASRPGASEVEIAAEGNRAMIIEAAGRQPAMVIEPGSRPVAGMRTVIPHALTGMYRIAERDIVMHGTGAVAGGYCCEVERTMFVGQPTPDQKRAFEVMLSAHLAGIEAIGPGVPARDVDRVCREAIERAGYGQYLLHRTGHGMGLESHELPHLALTDDTILQPGMVVTVEPGLYIPTVGGFRHSDTIVVTGGGRESLTRYPRGLQELTH